MSALDVSIVNVAMPTLKSAFGVSMRVIEWVAMAYMLTLIIFLPLFGRLADIYGRSRLYNIGFVVFSAGSLLCGLSPTADFMISARIIQAIGAGLLQANSVAIITQAFPARERGKAIGIQGAVQAISMAAGPFIGGILIAGIGWRSIFYVNIPIGILGIVAGLLILPADEKSKEKRKIDFLGAAFFASGLAFVVLGVNEAVKFGWGSQRIITYLVSGAVALALFVITELRVKHPLIDLGLFRNLTFFLGNISSMLSYYVLFALLFLMPFYLERVLGYGITATGLLLTPALLAMAAVAPFSGHFSDRHGSRIMTTSGMMISALACFSLIFMGESAGWPVLVGAMVLLGFGMGMFTPSNNSAIMGSAPSEKLGVAGGILNMTRSLGLIFGVNISGMVFTTLEHRYLAKNGYPHASRIFSNGHIPVPIKASAFMHGFIMVIMILLLVALAAAFISAARKAKSSGIIDNEARGAMVLSSGILSFSQESAGTAVLLILLLFAGFLGTAATTRLHATAMPQTEIALTQEMPALASPEAGAPQGQQCIQQPTLAQAKDMAAAYYAAKYKDRDVDISVAPEGHHLEAEVRKNGLLVKKLKIVGNKITVQRTGVRDWLFDLQELVN